MPASTLSPTAPTPISSTIWRRTTLFRRLRNCARTFLRSTVIPTRPSPRRKNLVRGRKQKLNWSGSRLRHRSPRPRFRSRMLLTEAARFSAVIPVFFAQAGASSVQFPTFIGHTATKFEAVLNTPSAPRCAFKGGLLMADDMEKNRQQGQQSGQSGQRSGQSGQQGQPGQTGQGGQQSGQPGQQKKGGQGQNEEDEDMNRQRRAS